MSDDVRQRKGGPGRLLAVLGMIVLFSHRAQAQELFLYQSRTSASGAIDLNVVNAPPHGPVHIRVFLGGTDDAPGPEHVAHSTVAGADGSIVVPIDRDALRRFEAATVMVQALSEDPTTGEPLSSNVQRLTARPTLCMLLESFDGSPLPTRVVEYDPAVQQVRELLTGIRGKGHAQLDSPNAHFDVQSGSGAAFFVPSDAPSTLLRTGVEEDPRAGLSFGSQEIVDVVFTDDQTHLMVLTRSSAGGRNAYALHAIGLNTSSADRLTHHSSGRLFSDSTGESDVWLEQSDDSRRVFVVIRNDRGVDRIQQWVVHDGLHEGRLISPIRGFWEEIRQVQVAGEFLASANEDTRSGAVRVEVFHLPSNQAVLAADLPGGLLGLELWETAGGARLAALTDAEGGTLYRGDIRPDREPVAVMREPLLVQGAVALAASPLGQKLFVGTEAGEVMLIDGRRGQVESSIVRGLPHGIRRMGIAGDAHSLYLYLTIPERDGSPADELHCFELHPATGQRLGDDSVRVPLGGSVTQIRVQ